MKRILSLIALVALALCFNANAQSRISNCTFNGIPLYGKVKVVSSFADFKVKQVSSFEDLKVDVVSSFANSCGKWQFVDSFPDFTIEFVDAFEDFSIKMQ